MNNSAKRPSQSPAIIYAAGSCPNGSGPGGWAAIVVPAHGGRIVRAGRSRKTTREEMQLRAIIEGLNQTDSTVAVNVHTDSHFVSDTLRRKRAKRWLGRGNVSSKAPTTNWQLWRRLMELCAGNGKRVCEVKTATGYQAERMHEEAVSLALDQATSAKTAK